MDILLILLRTCLAPVLVLLTTAVQRHWGHAVGGRLAGLPLTSGPVVVVLLIEHGPAVATQAAAGTLDGLLSGWALCLAYAVAARHGRGWPTALLAALTVFAASTVLLWLVGPPLPVTLVLLAVAMTGTLRWRPPGIRAAAGPSTWWDLPLRMACAGAMVLALTSASDVLGPRVSGLLTPLQAVALVLAVFTHRTQGGAAAAHFLRGVIQGFFAYVGFFLVLTLALPRWPSPAALLLACATAALVQAIPPLVQTLLRLVRTLRKRDGGRTTGSGTTTGTTTGWRAGRGAGRRAGRRAGTARRTAVPGEAADGAAGTAAEGAAGGENGMRSDRKGASLP